jgi:beta-lactamase class C
VITVPKLARRMAIAIAVTCLAPVTACAADDAAKMRAIVDTAIRPVMTENDVAGMAVAVTVEGKVFFFNYGVASKETGKPVSPATLFELGSVSKTFTATLGAYAQELGKLSLDDHPGKFMPQLKGSPIDKASLLNLVTYTGGGLPLQVPADVAKDDQLLGYLQQWKAPFPAGTERSYSNPSIGLFGHIAALALQRDFADAVETQLFPQLGMKHSYVRVPDSAMGNYAWGYDDDNKPTRVTSKVLAYESYGVKSSTTDLIRFVQANIDPSRLDGPMRRAVQATHVGHFKVADNMVQGLGWEQYPYPVPLERLLAGNSSKISAESNAAKQFTPGLAPTGPTLFNKTGSTNGFSTYVAFVPEKKIGVVMLANRDMPRAARITAALAILDQLTK